VTGTHRKQRMGTDLHDSGAILRPDPSLQPKVDPLPHVRPAVQVDMRHTIGICSASIRDSTVMESISTGLNPHSS
jgi:hypothetical protein